MSFEENFGYITFKDSKFLIFYTNDLSGRPSSTFMYSSDKKAIDLVHGLAYLSR